MRDETTTRLGRRALLGGIGVAGVGTLLGAPSGSAAAQDRRPHRVLVFSRTAGFRHTSIEIGVETIKSLGAEHGFAVEATEDHRQFRRNRLRDYTAVIFLNTTGNVLDDRGRAALRRFVRRGGGWVGVHSAADTEYDWPFYTRLLAGARFLSHPVQQPGVIVREAARHRSTRHLPERWQLLFEEFYSFTANPRGRARVLLSIDESTYEPDPNTTDLPPASDPQSGVMGDHPMAWQHRLAHGLAWYTALGHESAMYADPDFRRHLLGGILTATRHGRRHLGRR
jgi:type 1 glutamine amidotransferase